MSEARIGHPADGTEQGFANSNSVRTFQAEIPVCIQGNFGKTTVQVDAGVLRLKQITDSGYPFNDHEVIRSKRHGLKLHGDQQTDDAEPEQRRQDRPEHNFFDHFHFFIHMEMNRPS